MTTLASVGYGDMRPISNSERIITAFIFLVGVAAFSFIMGNFIDMLMEFKTVTAENEDHSGLSKFFSLLARFNSGHPLPKEMRRRIEKYFEYFWARDLNYAMKSEADQRFISELPKEIRISVSRNPYNIVFYPFHRSTRTFCSTNFCTNSGLTSKFSDKTLRRIL